MAAFASDHRSPGIRFLIIFLALIMAFSAVSLPVYALSESVALFGLAAVLSSATAALGFKLTNNQEGINTINRMCADFVKSALAPALVVIGTRVNGLQNDMAYIKMQVKEGKTYLDARVLAWVQQWLSNDGVYDNGTITYPDYKEGQTIDLNTIKYNSFDQVMSILSAYLDTSGVTKIIDHYNLDLSDKIYDLEVYDTGSVYIRAVPKKYLTINKVSYYASSSTHKFPYYTTDIMSYDSATNLTYNVVYSYAKSSDTFRVYGSFDGKNMPPMPVYLNLTLRVDLDNGLPDYCALSNISGFEYKMNNTGLSGQDTIGEDYKNKTLEQILQGLKDHAPDWYDAGADSSTNSTVGAKDLPVTVPAGAASENPSLNPDAVYNPPFDQPLDDTRSGATSSTTVADGVTNANTAESSEAAAATVSETQTIIDSMINWANNYISPDKGLFSKFPLCIPYDVYLLVSSALGVDARDISDIVNANTSDIGSLSNDSTAVNPQSDFVPVVDIQHDFNLDGYTYPIRISFDLTPYEPLIKINRIFLSIALIAELIGSEYKRIRWGK